MLRLSPYLSPISFVRAHYVLPGQGDPDEALRWPEARNFRSPQEVSAHSPLISVAIVVGTDDSVDAGIIGDFDTLELALR